MARNPFKAWPRSRIMYKAWSFREFGYAERFRQALGFDKWHIGHPCRYGRAKLRPYFAYQRRAEGTSLRVG